MTRARFCRELRGGETGPDVEAVGRALARAGFLDGLTKFMQKTVSVRRTYGDGKKRGVNRARAKIKLPQTGVYDRAVHAYLERLDAFDKYAKKLLLDYAPPPTLVFPVTPPFRAPVCQSFHETAGLPGNYALDFCAQPGAGIVAVERGRIVHLGGHPPTDDTWDSKGVFGWSVRFVTSRGYGYFVTHLGWRLPSLAEGLTVEAGDLLGKVGDQEFQPHADRRLQRCHRRLLLLG